MVKRLRKTKSVFLMLAVCFFISVFAITGDADAATKSGWQKEEKHALSARTNAITYVVYYYQDSNGHLMNDEWKKIGGKWYYFTNLKDQYNFSAYGRMAANEWIKGYWFNKNGTCTYKYKASWKSDKKGYWYGDTNGWYAKRCWQKIDGKDYYFNANGYMVTGWQKIGGNWYYFKKNGAMAAQEEIKMGGYRYYFFGDGSYYQFSN